MQQVAYADGKLWGNLNTVVKTPNGNVQVGNAWFVVQPGWKNGALTGSMVNQGYVSVNRANVLYGVIAANNDGSAAMGFTLVGRDYYPSTAYVTLGSQGPASDVHLVAAGAAPEDGFTGYALFGGTGTARWGDYSAGMADENGNLWLANQYIGARSSIDRTLYANWGTYIVEVAP